MADSSKPWKPIATLWLTVSIRSWVSSSSMPCDVPPVNDTDLPVNGHSVLVLRLRHAVGVQVEHFVPPLLVEDHALAMAGRRP
jgi:hypothetical protein